MHARLCNSLATTLPWKLLRHPRQNGENVNPFGAMASVAGERAMDRMDRPRTSIDERMLSGRRAVVIVWWAVAGFWLFFIDLLLLVAATFCILDLDFCVLAYWGSAALLLSL